jgi:hypothetical protein
VVDGVVAASAVAASAAGVAAAVARPALDDRPRR